MCANEMSSVVLQLLVSIFHSNNKLLRASFFSRGTFAVFF